MNCNWEGSAKYRRFFSQRENEKNVTGQNKRKKKKTTKNTTETKQKQCYVNDKK